MIASVAFVIAIGVNVYARCGVLGPETGSSEAEPICTEVLRELTRRDLRGVTLVIIDAQEGIRAAVSKALCATWQRCRTDFLLNALAHAAKSGRRVVPAVMATALAGDIAEAAVTRWRLPIRSGPNAEAGKHHG